MSGAPGPHSSFVVQLGGMVADEVAPPGAPRVSNDALVLLAALLTGDWATADASDERARAQASGIIAAYTQFHLERGLRSLPHVDRAAATAPASRRAAAAPHETAVGHPDSAHEPVPAPVQPRASQPTDASIIQEISPSPATTVTLTIGHPA